MNHSLGREMLIRLGFATMFVVAGFVGRATILDGRALSLVWPASGAALVWLLRSSGRRDLAVDLGLLALATFTVNHITGSTSSMSRIFVVANLIQVGVVLLLLRRWAPELFLGDRLTAPLETPRAVLRFFSATCVGCLGGVMVGTLGMWRLQHSVSLDATLTWWGRNVCGVLSVGTVGLLATHFLATRTAPAAKLRRHGAQGRVELLALVGTTTALVLVDDLTPGLPLAFLLPATTVWAGMRFPTTVVAMHSLAGCAAVVWLTLAGEGPFVGAGSLERTALLAQLFVGMTIMVGLLLATSRQEAATLHAGLEATERASAEQALLLRAIITSMSEGVVVVGADRNIALANPAAASFLGLPAAGLKEQPAIGFPLFRPNGMPLPVDERPSVRALQGERTGEIDVCFNDQPGARVYSASATPLAGRDGSPGGAVIVFHDVTHERAHQDELAAFASRAAHDLLNPISVIAGWSAHLVASLDIDDRDDASRARLDTARRIESASARVSTLVSDLLVDATSRNRNVARERVHLDELARDVAVAYDAGASVTVHEVPAVLGDPVLLRQVLDNLIGNSLKYVRPGTEPEITVTGRPTVDGMVELHVADRGVGIPAGMEEQIFDDFSRGHPNEFPGTGLGLSICRRNVERHGGRIAARSRADGAGAVVTVSLPSWQPQLSANHEEYADVSR